MNQSRLYRYVSSPSMSLPLWLWRCGMVIVNAEGLVGYFTLAALTCLILCSDKDLLPRGVGSGLGLG